MSESFTGRCACGAVTYTCNAEPAAVMNCHCRDCQYSAGGPYTTIMMVPEASLSIEGTVKTYTSTGDSGNQVHRQFCPECGTPIFSKPDILEGMKVIKVPTLDDPSAFAPAMHIYTQSKQPWTELSGEVPVFATTPNAG